MIMEIKNRNIFSIIVQIGIMLLITIVILFIVFRWIHSYTRHGEYIEVPAVIGLNIEEATDSLSAVGLNIEISDYRYDADLEQGEIIEQRPKISSFVKEGHIIYLTVNSGNEPMKVIPDVADNSSLRGAESRLLGAGFKLTEPTYQAGDKDWVYDVIYNGQSVHPGMSVPEGSTLTIVVGNGDPIQNIESVDSITNIESEFFEE